MMAGKRRVDNKGRVLPPNVTQYSDLRYVWRKSIDGKQYVIADKNLGDLRKKITQKEMDIQNGICKDLEKSTLNQWFYKWLDLYKGNIKQITKENYQKYYKWYIEDSLIGKMQIGKIKRTHIIELYKELSEVRGLATGTIKYVNSLLHSCLSDAVSDKLLLDNPCNGAIGKIEKKEPNKREALTKEQQATFINFIANSQTYNIYLPLFSFMLGTGCRIGETLGVRWDDINLQKNVISINHTMSYKPIDGKHKFLITTPKTPNSIRDIPIIEDLRKQLLKQRELQLMLGISRDFEVDGYSNFVFTTKNGKPYTQESINRIIRYIINACNKEEQERANNEDREPILLSRFSAHTLRHTFCTRFCENENNIKVIQRIMGHSRINTTMDIYAHATKEKADEVMNNLNGKIKIC